MALADLLTKLEGRAVDTPDTSCNLIEVSAKPAPNKACTLDTPDTSLNINTEDWALFSAWLFHFADCAPLPVTFAPAVDHTKARSYYSDTIAAEPITDMPGKPLTSFRADSIVDRNESFMDDRRTCNQCTNLIAPRCQAAKRGEIVASRNYEPICDLPRRCEGYAPGADDPDKRHGRERWPGLLNEH